MGVSNPAQPGGRHLGTAEMGAPDFTTSSASAVDVTSLTKTITATGRPILIMFHCSGMYSTAADDLMVVQVAENGTPVGGLVVRQNQNAGKAFPAPIIVVRTPAAGSVTYKIQAYRFSGTGVLTIAAVAGFEARMTLIELAP